VNLNLDRIDKDLAKKIICCQKCELHELKVNSVKAFDPGKLLPSFGKNSKIMLVGQNPSSKRIIENYFIFLGHEKQKSSSQNFLDIFREFKVLEYFYITNLVKCSTINNKISKKNVIDCSYIFYNELEIVKPEYIVALGNSVYNNLKIILENTNYFNKIFKLKHPSYYYSYNKSKIKDYKKEIMNLLHEIINVHTNSRS